MTIMTARKAKSNTTPTVELDEVAPADLAPVDLDPPDPAIARWEELVDRDRVIYHGGDAEKVIPIPRPAWATPDGDIIGQTLGSCFYTSEFADVALRYRHGENDDEVLDRASLRIRAKLCGTGLPIIGMGVSQVVDGNWVLHQGVGMTPAEALELADVLRAAVDLLIGSDK